MGGGEVAGHTIFETARNPRAPASMSGAMDAIVLSFRGEPLRVFHVNDRPLEVGSGSSCDVVVHDPAVAARAWLVRRDSEGGLVVDDLSGASGKIALRPHAELALSDRYSLGVALDLEEPRSRELRLVTEPIVIETEEQARLSLVIGRGPGARRVRVQVTPLTVGTSLDCNVILVDRAVSARHCRIEPDRDGAWIRDLGSRNGTWLDGVRTGLGRIVPGSRLHLGRTEMFVVEHGRAGDARHDGLVAASPQMLEVLGAVERLAKVPYPVLVWGPSGAGKEGIARALHTRGPRARGPFVALNAAAIPRDLVESELFGHEKGAFTGADATRRGVFEQADRGTLFLDEVGELTLSVQARLLRVLDSWTVRRVGGEGERRVDVRLVCATHRDLRGLVARGGFRADLYYRLVQSKIEVAPLADRPDDVRALAQHFLAQAIDTLGPRTLGTDAIEALLAYAWPGNVRELRSVVLAAATSAGGILTARDVTEAMVSIAGPGAAVDMSPHGAKLVVEQHGSVSAAARALGIARTTLRDRLARGVVPPDGRVRRVRPAIA